MLTLKWTMVLGSLAAMVLSAGTSTLRSGGTPISAAILVSEKRETRCGWFENPTPGNAWLLDRDGEWIIGVQGGYHAVGEWPAFKDNQWVETNVHYGYGCACMTVVTDRRNRKILRIERAYARPLMACRKDKRLRKP